MLAILSFIAGVSLAHAQEAVPGEYIVKLKSMASPSGVLNKMQGKMSLKGSIYLPMRKTALFLKVLG
jgi:hypothetical protein